MSAAPSNIVIVGASAAGLTTAAALRRNGYDRDLTLVDAERHVPYDRPPLSKHLLTGEWGVDRVALKTEADLASLAVDIRSGVSATKLDVERSILSLTDATDLPFDRLVIATGVTPRVLPESAHLAGVHTLRTIDDTLALSEELVAGRHLVVVGGGFLGTEVAAAAIGLGLRVTLVNSRPTPLERSLGPAIGAEVAALHTGHGVELRTGPENAVQSLLSSAGRVTGVLFTDGSTLNADVVFVAIGASPTVDWLNGSGLSIGDGVECAPDLSAAPGIYAAGDVARWENPAFDESMRVEHRTNATEQAMHVGARLVDGAPDAFASVPYFWTDQYDLKLQVHGWIPGYDEVRILEGSLVERRMLAVFRRGDRVVGALGVGAAKALRQWRQLIVDRTAWADVVGG
ncbi:NAD(P)/FAD-dependent oxidoreductase [Mycetocola zhadangensis]|uniref:NAD(P)/FAD-dependent oxidoreductase n=1 Tax=Mycetocola zhadangensis TaxID=1164595 RepID=A0A3L7IS64_9MICO|nr:FAD-dependent oxidoreductase [Mycetocola zhadangensis]RLQ81013.1 NAD(P)/FAD-dependent oxidoreductase [Mycetocola zhadangensis]GGF03969.1 pyridine nucleotide-disulfide oxidoreductase [Mycetocola zhadangensis]